MLQTNESRRQFLKLAGYVPPIILTLSVMPAYANSGSGVIDRVHEDEREDENELELIHGNEREHEDDEEDEHEHEKRIHGNNGLGNGVDPAPPGIAKQGLPQNDEFPVAPGDPDYKHGGPK